MVEKFQIVIFKVPGVEEATRISDTAPQKRQEGIYSD